MTDRVVPFSEMRSALRGIEGDSRRGVRQHTATILAIGPPDRLTEAAQALAELGGSVRTILISLGASASPAARVSGHAVTLEGLRPAFLDNAVAALRLSSLPTVVWWRGGGAGPLAGVAGLADRLVLDAADPADLWPHARGLFETTAITDVRWTRLTGWRALMAHFFDVPEVRDAAASFRQLEIDASDVHGARLFAGWLSSALQWDDRVTVRIRSIADRTPLGRVSLGDGRQSLELRATPSGTCVETTARVEGHAGATRVVSLGEQDLRALIAEELRVRSRDLAFERALAAAEGIA